MRLLVSTLGLPPDRSASPRRTGEGSNKAFAVITLTTSPSLPTPPGWHVSHKMTTGQVRVLLVTPIPNAQHGNDGRHLGTCPHLSTLLRLSESQRLLQPNSGSSSKNCSETMVAGQKVGENQEVPSLWDICTQAVLRYQRPQQSHLAAVAFDVDMLPDEIRTYLAEHWACVVCRRFIRDNS